MNDPSYNNLGGSGSRASAAVGGGLGAASGGIAGTLVASTGVITLTNVWSGGTALRFSAGSTVTLLGAGTTNSTAPVYCYVTAANSSTITIATAAPNAPFTVDAVFTLTNGAVAVSGGGPFLINATASPSSGFLSESFDFGNTMTNPGDPNLLLNGAGEASGSFNGLIFSASGGQSVGPNLAVGGPYYLQFDFGYGFPSGFSPAKIISEVTLGTYQYTAETEGTWQFQGSPDGSTWVNVSAQFVLNPSGTAGVYINTVVPLTGAIGYRYYRMLGISGSPNAGRFNTVQGINFKIDDYSATVTPTLQSGRSQADANTDFAAQSLDRINTPIGNALNQFWFQDQIAWASDFSQGDWTLSTGTAVTSGVGNAAGFNTFSVRMGQQSLPVLSTSGATPIVRVTHTFNLPVDLSGTHCIVGLHGDTPPASGKWTDTAVSVVLTDISGNQNQLKFSQPFFDSFSGWLPRLSTPIGLGTLTGAFDATQVVSAYVSIINQQSSGQFQVTFDSLVFVDQPTGPAQICIQAETASDATTDEGKAWVNAMLSAGFPVNIGTNLKDGYIGTQGALTQLLAWQAQGCRITTYLQDWQTRFDSVDSPLSVGSKLGTYLSHVYANEGVGFVRPDSRIIEGGGNGSNSVWTPAVASGLMPYAAGFRWVNAGIGESPYVNDFLVWGQQNGSGNLVADYDKVNNLIAAVIAARGRYILFGDVQQQGEAGSSPGYTLFSQLCGVTAYMQASAAAQLAMGATTWLTGTAYTAGQFVSNLGLTYLCLLNHTSNGFSSDLAAHNWQLADVGNNWGVIPTGAVSNGGAGKCALATGVSAGQARIMSNGQMLAPYSAGGGDGGGGATGGVIGLGL